MWDIETIKHINAKAKKGNPELMSKLWRYMKAWKKHRISKRPQG